MIIYQRKRNRKIQILAFLLSFLLLLNPPLTARLVFAEEIESPPEGGGEIENSIETGDAGAASGTETDVNNNQTEVPGEVSTDPCEPPEVECSGTTEVTTDNQAEVESDSTAGAATGENEITGGDGDASIDTGDAAALADSENQVNTNTTLLTDPEATEAADLVDGEVEAASNEEGGVSLVSVENDNDAEVDSETTAEAETGENQANENEGDASIETGDAIAIADSANLINTNITGSDFQYLVFDDSDLAENSDLYQIWLKLLGGEGVEPLQLSDGVSLSFFLVDNENLACLVNQTTAVADTGGNEASGNDGSATIETGDAFASANAFNLVNTNIVGSQFLVIVINIFQDFVGSIILPSQDYFFTPDQVETDGQELGLTTPSSSFISVENQNQAEVENMATADASTGENQTNNNSGDSLIETGDAFAQANSMAIVNTNVFSFGFFTLMINNFGTWLGQILNWTAPGENSEPSAGNQLYYYGQDLGGIASGAGGRPYSRSVIQVTNNNSALVSSTASASASTGGNQANNNQGGAIIRTGDAIALANSISLVNSNFFGSVFLFGILNIFGSWVGDLIFAYPDLAIGITDNRDEISPGEVLEYYITYANLGDAPAEDAAIHQDLPADVNLISVNSPQPEINGNAFDWQLGSLAPGESGEITVRMEVDPGIPTDNGPLKTTAVIGGNGVESNDENNSSTDTTVVVFPDSTPHFGTPILSLSSSNNVNEFVYPGDTILFELVVENEGEGSVYDAVVYNELYNEIPGPLANSEVELGEVKPGEIAVVSFGLVLPEEAGAGQYWLVSWVKGKDGYGEGVSSNEASSEFEVRLKGISSLLEAQAAEERKILGAASDECPGDEDILPYVLLFLLSSFWILDKSKKLCKIEAQS